MKLPKPPSFRLDGKRAIVIGASSGIGLGCSVALASVGAEVVVAARRMNKLNELVDSINSKGWTSSAYEFDVTKPQQIKNFFKINRPFDIAVYSAGMAKHSNILQTNEKDYDEVLEVNMKGAYFFAQSFANSLVSEDKKGSLIFISSQMAKVGGIDRSVYSGSKHALEGFQKTMAIEWGPFGIRVNSICPTFIKTDLTKKTFSNPDRLKWIEEKIKIGRIGEIEDIMGATVFLASEASSLITGTSILVDGGWTAS